MYIKYIPIFFLFFLQLVVNAQDSLSNSKKINSLKYELANAKDDSGRINAMAGLAFNYQVLNIDSALKYCHAGINLATRIGHTRDLTSLLATLSGIIRGNLQKHWNFFLNPLRLLQTIIFLMKLQEPTDE